MPLPLGSDPQIPDVLRCIDWACMFGLNRTGFAPAEATRVDVRTTDMPAINNARITASF